MSEPNCKNSRLQHANDLIRVIGSHGRRFFYHAPSDRYARFELRQGRVYYVDEYSQKAIYTYRSAFGNRWQGFSHGGTLRTLVEDMRNYILHGKLIARWKIVIQSRERDDLVNNIWGYSPVAAQAVREAAYALPIIALAGVAVHV